MKMCRVYRKQGRSYVRLCYVHGDRRGEHVPVPDGFVLQGRHYPKDRKPVRKRPSARTRCVECGAPMDAADVPLCRYCVMEIMRGVRMPRACQADALGEPCKYGAAGAVCLVHRCPRWSLDEWRRWLEGGDNDS